MSADTDVDELGPVDYIVVEFPGSKFSGEIAPALMDLVNRDLIRVLDLVLVTKDESGAVEAFEIGDLDDTDVGELRNFEAAVAMLLSEDDVMRLSETMDPGSTAAVLVWENKWAAPFASAMRRAGGQLVSSGRIPIQAIVAALEEEDAMEEEGA
jgi:hypothetical protein